MRRLLLTGISGTGKSALVTALRARGRLAVDLDCPEYCEWVEVGQAAEAAGPPVEPGRDWVWREGAVRGLLAAEPGEPLFVSGCAPNMAPFLPCFDHVVLLSAPADVIAARLRARPPGEYGRRADEIARVVAQKDSVEPLLRRVADHELDTRGAVEDAASAILEIALTRSARR